MPRATSRTRMKMTVLASLFVSLHAYAAPTPMYVPKIADPAVEAWTNSTAGRVLKLSGGGSAVLVGFTPQGAGIFLTAGHVMAEARRMTSGHFSGREDGTIREAPTPVTKAGSAPSQTLLIYNPVLQDHASSTRVASDFAVGLVGDEFKAEDAFDNRYRVTEQTLRAYNATTYTDPGHHLRSARLGQVKPLGEALAIGYPATGSAIQQPYYSTGTILDSETSTHLLEKSQDPFDPSVEFLILFADGEVGMSGGGVFDHEGGVIGIIVRTGTLPSGTPYLRAVRADYALAKAKERLTALHEQQSLSILSHIPLRGESCQDLFR